MNQNQNEVAAVAAVAPTSIVSAMTLAYGASVQNAQMAFAVSMAFDCLPSVVNETKGFTYAKYIDEVEQRSGHSLGKKTIQNNMTLTRALIDKHRIVMATYSRDEAGVNAFMGWMREQIGKTTYALRRDELIAWCKGETSAADKRAKLAEDNAAAAAAIAANASAAPAAPAAAPVPLADAIAAQAETEEQRQQREAEEQQAREEQAEREAAAAEQARIAGLAMQAEREKREQAEAKQREAEAAQAAAEKAQRQAEDFLIRVGITEAGAPNIIVDRTMSPDFLDRVAKELATMAKALRKSQQTAMGQALVAAKKAA